MKSQTTNNLPSKTNRIDLLLKDFSTLKDNWDYDDAKAPNEDVLTRAHAFLTRLKSFNQEVYHAVPGPEGEVMLDLRILNYLNLSNSFFTHPKLLSPYFQKMKWAGS